MPAMGALLAGAALCCAAATAAATEESRSFTEDHTGGAIFLFFAIVVGIITRTAGKALRLPYTVVLLAIGLLLGLWNSQGDLGILGDSISTWEGISPELILVIFIPALVFGSALSVDYHVFAREIGQMLLLAVPGVIISALLTALFAMYALPYGWGWNEGLAFGAMMSATDPVAVVALLKELGASKRLSLLIEGESLFNDGTAFVFFIVFSEAMKGIVRSPGETVGFFAQLALGGPAVGLLLGIISVYSLRWMAFDTVAQIATTVFAAYATFLLSEVTPIHVSSVLATVVLGLTMAAQGRTLVQEHETLHEFWEMVEYMANTIVFVLSGVIMVERGFNSDLITAADWGWLVLLYLVLNVVRLITISALSPGLQAMGYGITRNDVLVMSWAGLRGAVGLVLALFIDEGGDLVPRRTAALFLFHMAGIAVLTLVVNGSTTGALLKYLGMVRRGQASELMFVTALHHVEDHIYAKEQALRHDALYANADWPAVHSFLGVIFNELYDELEVVRSRKEAAVGEAAVGWGCCAPCCGARKGLRQTLGPSQQGPRVALPPVGGEDAPSPDSATTPSSIAVVPSKRGEGKGGAEDTPYSDAPATPGEGAAVPPPPDQLPVTHSITDMYSGLTAPPALSAGPSSDDSDSLPDMSTPKPPAGDAPSPISHASHPSAVELAALQGLAGDDLLPEARLRFLTLLKAEYWTLYESGMISNSAVVQLVEAASTCQDDPSTTLCDFDMVDRLIKTNTVRSAGDVLCGALPALRTWWQLDSLYFDFELVFGFIEGHRAVHRIFPEVVGSPAVAKALVDESLVQVVKGRTYITALERTLPELAAAVKTKHAIRALMHDMKHQATHLLHHGEIDEREHTAIVQRVYAAWQNARVNVCVPNEAELLRAVGYLAQLDDATFDTLYKKSRRVLLAEGDLLTDQGATTAHCFIIIRGEVHIRRRVRVVVEEAGEGGSGQDQDLVVCRTVDTVGRGAVLGLLPMLTGSKQYVTSVAAGPVVAVRLNAKDIYTLLRSTHNPDPDVHLRVPSALESVLCRMAAAVVGEALLAAQLNIKVKSATVRAMMEMAEFVRPEPKLPLTLDGRIILLTGAELTPRDLRSASLAAELAAARAVVPSDDSTTADAFDAAYHARASAHEGDLPELADSQFRVKHRAFSVVEAPADPTVKRWFSRGTRLLVLGSEHDAVFRSSVLTAAKVHRQSSMRSLAHSAAAALAGEEGGANHLAMAVVAAGGAASGAGGITRPRRKTLRLKAMGSAAAGPYTSGFQEGQDVGPSFGVMDRADLGGEQVLMAAETPRNITQFAALTVPQDGVQEHKEGEGGWTAVSISTPDAAAAGEQ